MSSEQSQEQHFLDANIKGQLSYGNMYMDKASIHQYTMHSILCKYGMPIEDALEPERCRIILFSKDGDKIALIKRERECDVTYYSFPGGRIEETDKSPIDAIKRETKEELNLNENDYLMIENKVIVGQGVYKRELAGQTFTYYAFLAISNSNDIKMVGEELQRDKKERGTYEAVWINLRDLKETNVKDTFLKRIILESLED